MSGWAWPGASWPHDVVTREGGDLLERRSATFDPSGTYRYTLVREWGDQPKLVWLMLNPSTADHEVNDPTVVRCRLRAMRAGYGGIVVVNLFALRATDPRELQVHPSPVGPLNDDAITGSLLGGVGGLVVAWGAQPNIAARARDVLLRVEKLARQPLCLGTTKAGHPRHPLMVGYAQQLVPYAPPPA